MTPSLFSSEYSRGPLYQYWKDRSAEEKATRDQRIEEAKLRSKGFKPLSPAPGPSSNESYVRRATSGPPGYIAATMGPSDTSRGGRGTETVNGDDLRSMSSSERETSSNAATGPRSDDLPSYIDATGTTPTARQTSIGALGGRQGEPSQLLSAEDEKARLARLEAQRRQIDEDAAIARAVSSTETEPVERQASVGGDSQVRNADVRRKSTSSKIGKWLADAAGGYSKKQERW